MRRVEAYRREDGDWGWRMVASNGNTVATGGEGYRNCSDMVHVALTYIIRDDTHLEISLTQSLNELGRDHTGRKYKKAKK